MTHDKFGKKTADQFQAWVSDYTTYLWPQLILIRRLSYLFLDASHVCAVSHLTVHGCPQILRQVVVQTYAEEWTRLVCEPPVMALEGFTDSRRVRGKQVRIVDPAHVLLVASPFWFSVGMFSCRDIE